jgi:hypothetical protein
MSIMPVSCSICGEAHPRWECPKWEVPAREAPRSNAQSPSRRTRDTDIATAAAAPASTPLKAVDPPPGNLGFVPLLERLRTMNDAELKVSYNAVMAEYMRRRRAKQKAHLM